MRRQALRQLLRSIALAAVPLGAGCGGAPVRMVDASCETFDFGDTHDWLNRQEICVRYVPIDGGLPDGPYDCQGACGWRGDPLYMVGGTCPPVDVCGYHGVVCGWCSSGRRPPGLVEDPAPPGCEAGVYFATMAHLEAASIPAFRRLAVELSSAGAPAGLVREARRAARDEIRHARVCSTLARRHGVAPPRPRIAPAPARGLLELILDNAVEGCVREGFGALVAEYQSHAAADPEVRAALAMIADDEARHGELAWDIDRWATRVLGEGERRLVAERRAAALDELERASNTEVSPSLRRLAGLPGPEAIARLVAGYRAVAAQLVA